MSEYEVERPRHAAEIERVDEQRRISDIATAAAAHEASKLFLNRSSSPLRLLLQDAEGAKVP